MNWASGSWWLLNSHVEHVTFWCKGFLHISNKMHYDDLPHWQQLQGLEHAACGGVMCKLLCRWAATSAFVHAHVCRAHIHVVKVTGGKDAFSRPVRQLATKYCVLLWRRVWKKAAPACLIYLSSESLLKGLKKTKKNNFANKEDQEERRCTYWHEYWTRISMSCAQCM